MYHSRPKTPPAYQRCSCFSLRLCGQRTASFITPCPHVLADRSIGRAPTGSTDLVVGTFEHFHVTIYPRNPARHLPSPMCHVCSNMTLRRRDVCSRHQSSELAFWHRRHLRLHRSNLTPVSCRPLRGLCCKVTVHHTSFSRGRGSIY